MIEYDSHFLCCSFKMTCEGNGLPPDLLKNHHKDCGIIGNQEIMRVRNTDQELMTTNDELDEDAVSAAMLCLEKDGLTNEDPLHELFSSVNVSDEADSGSNTCFPVDKVIRLEQTPQIRELQTVLRDRTTSRGDFVFFADRLIRLVVEEGLNSLPYREMMVTTPTGKLFDYAEGRH